jgi:SAM-dependent methyltransferase
MKGRDSREAWGRFWADGGAGPESGCLPNALKAMDSVEREVWQGFAKRLAKGARVLDLATGDGLVLGKMKAGRPDLKLTGVDSSPVLPLGRHGIKLRAGIDMEQLPFADRSFDAVTSQFGFEYGEWQRAAAEVSRVLKPGGKLQFVVHYRDGPIVAHNLPLGEALEWAVREAGYLEKARALVRARAKARLPTPPLFRSAPADARRRFPGQPVAEEFLTAVLQTLVLSYNAPPAEALEVLQQLEDRAANQLGRIESLMGAACDSDEVERLVGHLAEAGLEIATPRTISEGPNTAPFAWLLSGAKPRN